MQCNEFNICTYFTICHLGCKGFDAWAFIEYRTHSRTRTRTTYTHKHYKCKLHMLPNANLFTLFERYFRCRKCDSIASTTIANTFRFVLSLAFWSKSFGMFILIYCSIWIRFVIYLKMRMVSYIRTYNVYTFHVTASNWSNYVHIPNQFLFFCCHFCTYTPYTHMKCWYLILIQISCIIYVECLF